MNQWQYDTICEAIRNGVPALADNLISAFQTLVSDYQSKCKELADTKAELETYKVEDNSETSESKKEKNK